MGTRGSSSGTGDTVMVLEGIEKHAMWLIVVMMPWIFILGHYVSSVTDIEEIPPPLKATLGISFLGGYFFGFVPGAEVGLMLGVMGPLTFMLPLAMFDIARHTSIDPDSKGSSSFSFKTGILINWGLHLLWLIAFSIMIGILIERGVNVLPLGIIACVQFYINIKLKNGLGRYFISVTHKTVVSGKSQKSKGN